MTDLIPFRLAIFIGPRLPPADEAVRAHLLSKSCRLASYWTACPVERRDLLGLALLHAVEAQESAREAARLGMRPRSEWPDFDAIGMRS